jgi:hypothetical protein
VRIELDKVSLTATIPDTGSQRNFKMVRAGEADIASAGWHELRIVPERVPQHSVMVLRGVRLAAVGTSS